MVANVLVELSNRNIDKCFTYNVPLEFEKSIKIGIRVEVPFGKQYLEGFVLEINNDKEKDIELKDIRRLIDDEVILNDELLELGKYIKKSTLCTLISAYQVMLPKALKIAESFLEKEMDADKAASISKFISAIKTAISYNSPLLIWW